VAHPTLPEMAFSVTTAERRDTMSGVVPSECACDDQKVSIVRVYVMDHFPGRVLRDAHSCSTVVEDGVVVPSADYHVISIGVGVPCCAVLTRRFLALPVDEIAACLRRGDLARALGMERTVLVDSAGISPL